MKSLLPLWLVVLFCLPVPAFAVADTLEAPQTTDDEELIRQLNEAAFDEVFREILENSASFKDGADAFKRGDYQTAFEKLKPLAEQGDVGADVFSLGEAMRNAELRLQARRESIYLLDTEDAYARWANQLFEQMDKTMDFGKGETLEAFGAKLNQKENEIIQSVGDNPTLTQKLASRLMKHRGEVEDKAVARNFALRTGKVQIKLDEKASELARDAEDTDLSGIFLEFSDFYDNYFYGQYPADTEKKLKRRGYKQIFRYVMELKLAPDKSFMNLKGTENFLDSDTVQNLRFNPDGSVDKEMESLINAYWRRIESRRKNFSDVQKRALQVDDLVAKGYLKKEDVESFVVEGKLPSQEKQTKLEEIKDTIEAFKLIQKRHPDWTNEQILAFMGLTSPRPQLPAIAGDTVIETLTEKAQKGNALAQSELGRMYANGEGVAQDFKEAVNWWRKAADQGLASAQLYLGWMYVKGRGVAQDDREAVKWYRKAADQGDAWAQFYLGWMYVKGRGVAQDEKEAVNWWHKAAEQGDAEVQSEFGRMYANGEGVAQDDREAVKWYRKAADQGLAWAQYILGMNYDTRFAPIYGEGVAQDDREAVKWYRKAADQGLAEAQDNLGEMYAEGRGVTQDYKEAVNWYRKAAEQGDAWAQSELGEMYAEGRGVTQDYVQAHKWYNIAGGAAGMGKVAAALARENRDKVEKKMTPEQIAEAQKLAGEWMERQK